MRRSRIFATVIYFIFTFGIGVVFSLTLPGYFATFTVPAEIIGEALGSGDFLKCLILTEPVGFAAEPVLNCTFEEGGGVVLFETVAEVYDSPSSEEDKPASGGLTNGMLYKAYTGYLYGVEDRYDVFAAEGNQTSLRVTQADGTEKTLPFLDYDSDGNGTKDGISTYSQAGFIVLELRGSDLSSVKKLVFTDKTGAEVLTAEADRDLTFDSALFDCFGDIGSYNDLVAELSRSGITAEEQEPINAKRNAYIEAVKESLGKTEGCELTSQSEAYLEIVTEVNDRANGKAIPFIIIYFVAIYIIADFLLGTHFIIKFFQWFLFKVCKIRRKEKKPTLQNDVIGGDYYSMVTLKLDLSEVPEFHGSVGIKYMSGAGEEFLFTLLKEDGYAATLRMKAGVYVNPFIDIERAYGPLDLPDNLIVEGYQVEKIIKIGKREEESL